MPPPSPGRPQEPSAPESAQILALEKSADAQSAEQAALLEELVKLGTRLNEEKRRTAEALGELEAAKLDSAKLRHDLESVKRMADSYRRDWDAATATSQSLSKQVLAVSDQLVDSKAQVVELKKKLEDAERRVRSDDDHARRGLEEEVSRLATLLAEETGRREEAESRLLVEFSNV